MAGVYDSFEVDLCWCGATVCPLLLQAPIMGLMMAIVPIVWIPRQTSQLCMIDSLLIFSFLWVQLNLADFGIGVSMLSIGALPFAVLWALCVSSLTWVPPNSADFGTGIGMLPYGAPPISALGAQLISGA